MMRKAMIVLAATSFVGAMVAATAADAQWSGGYGRAGDGNQVSRGYPNGDGDWGVYEGYRYGGY